MVICLSVKKPAALTCALSGVAADPPSASAAANRPARVVGVVSRAMLSSNAKHLPSTILAPAYDATAAGGPPRQTHCMTSSSRRHHPGPTRRPPDDEQRQRG